MKKILSVLVALAFLASAVPAMAAEPTDAGTTAAPSGDKAAPKTTKKTATKKTTKKTSKDETTKDHQDHQAEPPPAK